MDLATFKKKARSLEPGKTLTYHIGFLAVDRVKDDTLDAIARFALSVALLGNGAVFQKKIAPGFYEYQLRVFKRLGMRVDGNGSFQEAERVASLA